MNSIAWWETSFRITVPAGELGLGKFSKILKNRMFFLKLNIFRKLKITGAGPVSEICLWLVFLIVIPRNVV